jgi:tetratricopeptide (TPR) repeat protein
MLGTRYRGRRQGVAVREGSVEEARREARLTLAQVAGDRLSRTAIHLIEKGRTRPSMETLQQIARQTRKPIDFFLPLDSKAALTERQTQLRELERLTAVRELQGVVNLSTTLLEQDWSVQDEALIHFCLGQAYCRLVRPAEALEHLRLARDEFERLADEWMTVETLDWQSSALGLLDDPEGLPLANQALERCRQLNPKAPQIEARILGHIAAMYVTAHAYVPAIRYYEAAASAAAGVKDLLQLAKMHHGLGVAYQHQQQPTTARQHYDKAITLYSIESDSSAASRVEIDLGDLLLQQGQLDSAEEHLLKALAGSTELKMERRGRGYILTNLGEVHLRRDEVPQARDYLEQALEVAEAVGERIVLANAHVLLELGMPDRLRDAHMEYAELLEARHDLVAASRHWKQGAEIGRIAALGLPWTGAATGAGIRESLA